MDENKFCLTCKKQLHGRTDKKFCNDNCRNLHNNQLNSDENNLMRNINHRLRKNRRILECFLLPSRHSYKISRQNLNNSGFSFAYFTHIHTQKNGRLFHFCYDYGYFELGEDEVMVLRKNKIE